MSGILGSISAAAAQLQTANALKAAIGAALTVDQQVALSLKVIDGPGPFTRWAATDSGKQAIQDFAAKFIAEAQ